MPEPAQMWLIRHGQSQGNVARDAPRTEGQEMLDIAERDMDVALSDLGFEQARAFGRWLGEQAEQPEVVVASPYLRAEQTARTICEAAEISERVHLDERLRERELGVLDLLTWHGVQVRLPDEARRRERLGKFYHRPPGGESWVDVALRLRSLRDSIAREHEGKRVMLVSHEVPILIMRYLMEELNEREVLGMAGTLPNCSLTRYTFDAEGHPHADVVGWCAPLASDGVPITSAPEAPVAPR